MRQPSKGWTNNETLENVERLLYLLTTQLSNTHICSFIILICPAIKLLKDKIFSVQLINNRYIVFNVKKKNIRFNEIINEIVN